MATETKVVEVKAKPIGEMSGDDVLCWLAKDRAMLVPVFRHLQVDGRKLAALTEEQWKSDPWNRFFEGEAWVGFAKRRDRLAKEGYTPKQFKLDDFDVNQKDCRIAIFSQGCGALALRIPLAVLSELPEHRLVVASAGRFLPRSCVYQHDRP